MHSRVTMKCLVYVLGHGALRYPFPQEAYGVDEGTIHEYSYLQSKAKCVKCHREHTKS